MAGKPWKMIAAALMLALGAGILTLGITGESAATRDYISYWSAGRLLVQHQNPYAYDLMLRTEQSAGYTASRPLFMRNAPIAFFLAYALGHFSARAGAMLWSLALIAAMVASVRMLWILLGRPADRTHLLAYLFAPVLACLLYGQMALLLLVAAVAFLYFHERRPFVAGAAFGLLALKPHVVLPFALIVLAWSVARRRYGVLAGATAVLASMLLFAQAVDPNGWTQYTAMMRGESLHDELIPTVSLFLRILIHRSWMWLQFVPVAIGSAWALWQWWKRRMDWDWHTDGAFLLAISVLVAPYAWFTDETLALPAVLVGLAHASRRKLRVYAVLCGAAMLEVLFALPVNSGYYVWTAPAWVMWCVTARQEQPLRAEVVMSASD